MKSVKSFINALGKNYYLEFIADPYSPDLDHDEYFFLVKHKNKEYYEKNIQLIRNRQEEIISEIKILYEEALSQIYLKLSTSKPENFDNFIKFNIDAAKIKLKTIQSDLFVDTKASRYYSKIIDNYDVDFVNDYSNRTTNLQDYPEDGSILKIVEKLKKNKEPSNTTFIHSIYFMEDHNNRFKIISFLPFSLYVITSRFIKDLMAVQETINEIKDLNKIVPKLKWAGKKTHIGFVLGTLAQEGYVDPPRGKDGEINYTAFAKLVKQIFDVSVGEDTLRKYLNPDEEKFLENKNTFEKHQFSLPNIKRVN